MITKSITLPHRQDEPRGAQGSITGQLELGELSLTNTIGSPYERVNESEQIVDCALEPPIDSYEPAYNGQP